MPYRPTADTTLTAKVDTGTQGNILPLRIHRRIFPNGIDSSGIPQSLPKVNTTLIAYDGSRIHHYVCTTLSLEYNGVGTEAQLLKS